MSNTPIILIPARMASTRLPGKPLYKLAGKPMISQVVLRALEADIGPVCVACDHPNIANAAQAAGAQAVMTHPDLPSGSDRIWSALQSIDSNEKYDLIVNLQGDLPTLEPHLITETVRPLTANGPDISTLVAPIMESEEETNPNVVKPIISWHNIAEDGHVGAVGTALYFTRATAPHGAETLYHHIGIYGYRRAALQRFTELPPSPLEQAEKLEQLRALEAGMRIDVVCVDTVPVGVDTEDDAKRADHILKGH